MFGLQISGGLWSWQTSKIIEIKISSLQVFSRRIYIANFAIFKIATF